MLKEGTKAPSFTLPDAAGHMVSLSDFAGKTVVLYFYPKDNTPGCTREAQAFRDAYDEYLKNNIAVIGVSKDSSESHRKFIEKNNLPFILLADTDHKVLEAYEAWGVKTMFGKKVFGTRRTTYVIDQKGMISKVYDKVNPDNNATQILQYLKNAD
jgi:peroxiredoxin Q/BCP